MNPAVKSPSVRPLSPLQRQSPRLNSTFTHEDTNNIQVSSVRRVVDLIVQHIPAQLTARLTQPTPDMEVWTSHVTLSITHLCWRLFSPNLGLRTFGDTEHLSDHLGRFCDRIQPSQSYEKVACSA